jgi:hypothetical protein
MNEKTLQEILLDDLMGNSSKSPRENAAVAQINMLMARIKELEAELEGGKSRPRAKRSEVAIEPE